MCVHLCWRRSGTRACNGKGKYSYVTGRKLQSDIQKLPTDLQQEVVDSVEFLLTKVDRNAARQEESEWSHAGLE